MAADWKFPEIPGNLVEQEPTQRDQFNNDEVQLSEALVREAIQNSGDAALSGDTIVRVSFKLVNLSGQEANDFASMFVSLERHLKEVGLDIALIRERPIRLLVIEDFGTTGLTGSVNSRDQGNFRNFWRRHGKSNKGGQTSGRWGLGKLVYSSTSGIRSFFGLTIRPGEQIAYLLGQAVLNNHDINGAHYSAHGFWHSQAAEDGLQLPICDAETVARFKSLSRISRQHESGLSIVVPFVPAELGYTHVIQSVAKNYFFPILAGQLEVNVGDCSLNSTSFLDEVRNFSVGTSELEQKLQFAYQVSQAMDDGPAYKLDRAVGTEQLVAELFSEAIVQDMRSKFIGGELVSLRLPIELNRKDGTPVNTFVDLYLKSLPEGASPHAFFTRGKITVPGEEKYFARSQAFGALVASDSGVTEFLGDAENPAHTNWNTNAEKLNNNWKNAYKSLRSIRYALKQLFLIVTENVEQEEQDLLLDIFSVAGLESPKKRRGPRTPPKPDRVPPRKSRPFNIHGRKGGFAITPSSTVGEQAFPYRVAVRAAYDILQGNPFKKHSLLDFDLRKKALEMETKNLTCEARSPNTILLTITSADFEFSISGFDPNRDLLVKAWDI